MRNRLILLIITSMIASNLLFAQNAILDSLKALINNHPQQDTARVNLMNTVALEIRRIDRKQMIPYAEEALQLAKKLNYDRGEGRAITNKALIAYDSLDFENALAS